MATLKAVLDLKAKLAAAGIVTKEQVEKFDEREARARQQKKSHKSPQKSSQGKGPQRKGAKHKSAQRNKPSGSRTGINVEAFKKMNKGEAYNRLRKVIGNAREDAAEQLIPKPDDQIYNFVTATGSIGRLYLTAEVVEKLRQGTSAISAFISHHGLSHCVLPKDLALDIADVFPLWLRSLQGHAEAGKIESPEPAEQSATDTPAPSESTEPSQ